MISGWMAACRSIIEPVLSTDLQGGGQTLWDVYKLFNLQGSRDWYAAARQLPKLIALFFVVTFGSSLDISAIQADLPIPLDYNRELQTVGALLNRC